MKKLIVTLMSVYEKDNSEHVVQAIQSVLDQDFKDILLLIGVDGKISEMLRHALNKYKDNEKVKIFWFSENLGLTAVLNNLLVEVKALKPAYIARMDADDISCIDRFTKQIAYMEANPMVDVVGGAIEEMDYTGELNGKIIKYPLTHQECFDFFATRNPLAHPAVLFRPSFFEKVNSYNSVYKKNQDTELWFRAFKSGCQFANISDVVLAFRVSKDMYKRRGGAKFALQVLRLRKEINKGLGYGLKATLFGYAYYMMAISPGWVKKFTYKAFR